VTQEWLVRFSLLIAMALLSSACGGEAAPAGTEVKAEASTTTGAPAPPTSPPPTVSPSKVPSRERSDTLKIRMTVGDRGITATLIDSPTTRDFVSLLPLTLTLRDYVGAEKIGELPKRLSIQDAPPGMDPSIGDIAYYAPWGNVAIFYRDQPYASGLVILGSLDAGTEALDTSGSEKVTIELLD